MLGMLIVLVFVIITALLSLITFISGLGGTRTYSSESDTTTDTSIASGTNGYVKCTKFKCTAYYNSRTFTKTCSQ